MSEPGSKLGGVDEEEMFMGLDADMGRSGRGVEIPEDRAGGSGPLGGVSTNAPPHGGCNVSGGLRLPLGGSEPLNQPSGNTGFKKCQKHVLFLY